MKQQIAVKILVHKQAHKDFVYTAKNKLNSLFVHDLWNFSTEKPDVLFFASGGSESGAIKYLGNANLILLVAFAEDNAYAAATEVKAYCDQVGCDTVLLSLDDPESIKFLNLFQNIHSALARLNGKKLGLIGNVSDWLIASDVSRELLREKFGVEVIKIPWEEVGDYKDFTPPLSFIKKYVNDKLDIEEAGRVQSALSHTIKDHGLDAITVECFSLVKHRHVTACLALSDLNDYGVPAGCEGDMTSITGMLILKQVTGLISWMANLVKVTANSALFAHCTAPTQLLNDFEITTHFETNEGTAIRGSFKDDIVTIVRFNNSFDKIFIASGKIVSRPTLAGFCRTQIEIELQKGESELLKLKPLGNHHLILPGNHSEKIGLFARIKGIEIL